MTRRRHGWRIVVIGIANLSLVGSLFVVTARAIAEAQPPELYLAAPEAAQGGLSPRAVVIEVTGASGFRISGRRFVRSELSQILRGPLASLLEPTVAVQPAPDANWQDVAYVLRVARELGATRVELLGSPPD